MRVGKFDFAYYKKLRSQPAVQNPDLIIVSTNELRSQYNKKAFAKLDGECISMDHIKDIRVNGKEDASGISADVIKAIKRECYQYDAEDFKVGCRIMVTENIDQSTGVVNGTRGHITAITGQTVTITTDQGRSAKITHIQKELKVDANTKVTFSELPLVVAYAITCHKA